MTTTAQNPQAAKKRSSKLILGHNLDWWNGATLVALFFAAAAALAIMLTQYATIRLQSQEAQQANLKIASLEKEAADAKLQQERLKAAFAWREISPEQGDAIEQALAAHPGSVNLRYTSGDPESLFFAAQIVRILEAAKWKIAPGGVLFANAVVFGIALPDSNGTDAQALRAAFTGAGIAFSTNPLPPQNVGFSISTIPGAPTLMVGSKAAPVLQGTP